VLIHFTRSSGQPPSFPSLVFATAAAHAATAPPAQARPPAPSGGRRGRPDPWGPRGGTQPTREIKAPGMPGLHERAAVESGKLQRVTGAMVVAAGSGSCG
jgi:hypothetical protein